MKQGIIREGKKITVTLLLMLSLLALSGIISWRISQLEEQACWEMLHQSVTQVADELERHVTSDQELLNSIADIILEQDSLDSPEVKKIIDGFQPNTMISHIALLLPGDKVLLPNESVRDTEGLLSFEKEAAMGTHISDRSVDIRDNSRQILRNFVPLIKDGETIAMLYGVVDLSKLPEHLANYASSYEGKSAIYVIDGNNGDYIVDTWHKSLGNLFDVGTRKVKRGYSQQKLQQDVFDGNVGHCVFVSETTGDDMYFYYEPIPINKWMVGISVTEDVAFDRVKKTNGLLAVFIICEILFLAFYFVWMFKTTKKELLEKQKLAETDVLTGLLNRNSYEKNLEKYSRRCQKNITCIYADVNGLHELNNAKGHTAGDRMLQMVAQTIQGWFGVRNTYRIGGDEFVAFSKDEEMDSIHARIEKINEQLQAEEYHVSFGIYRQEVPIDINSVIKQAETHMYEEKNRYYEQMGANRGQRS